MGMYPVEAVAMLAKIAAAIEPNHTRSSVIDVLKINGQDESFNLRDLISLSVGAVLEQISPAVVIVPSRSGASARSITRFRIPVWIVAVSSQEKTCRQLQFSYGVYPFHEPEHPENWNAFARQWLELYGVDGNLVVLTEGPSSLHPDANHRMEIIDLSRGIQI